MSKFTHFNEQGRARMVDVSGKNETVRTAVAKSSITVNREIYEKITRQEIEKRRCSCRCPSGGNHGLQKDTGYHPHVPSDSAYGCGHFFRMERQRRRTKIYSLHHRFRQNKRDYRRGNGSIDSRFRNSIDGL